ncbi:MAG TPA: Ni,Fe-hydrogenase I large subunit [Thiolapillus brandeum]|uniref:Ni,Fe-hydrogenase I large subunit n=1 Tax=Thiolapillus brandeum TaxID=1076588 RepID=A0A831KCD0_9GAMM|nr:Ni,Fe-hydrogenase I large subunit [Thiolapillus brandeum]
MKSDIEGSLNIQIAVDENNGNIVSIESTRPVHVSRLFEGKTAAEVLALLPVVFNVCAAAQSCAGVRACEQALDQPAEESTEQLRTALVRMEALREHLWRILLDWAEFVGTPVNEQALTEIAGLEREYRQALCADIDPFELGSLAEKTDSNILKSIAHKFRDLLHQDVFAMHPEQWLAIDDQDALFAWADSSGTIAARLISKVRQHGWENQGACHIDALPALTDDEIHQLLQDREFVRLPQLDGRCCETSSLSRSQSRLLDVLLNAHGNGLLSRLVARLTEIACLASQLIPEEETEIPAYSRYDDAGIGQAAAARGQLIHRVNLEGNRIVRYQILAPTEWNFHPRGVVAQALASLRGGADEIELQARLLINAIDPCVGYELQLK